MTDDHHLLAHYRRNQTQALVLRDHAETDTLPQRPTISKLPGDPFALRGIPCLCKSGIGGHIAGTRPDTARLDK